MCFSIVLRYFGSDRQQAGKDKKVTVFICVTITVFGLFLLVRGNALFCRHKQFYLVPSLYKMNVRFVPNSTKFDSCIQN
uniref:Uncharacterized protein n=1 Tax=Pararge aegeria TaxID=116150 RepID=S4PTD8_9NEOP